MNYEIESDGDAMIAEPVENAEFLCMGLGAGNFVGRFFARALEAELNVIEAGGDKRGELGFIEGESRGYEIDVKACGAGGADEFDDVGARERFAAGEVGLEDAGFGGFYEDARPHFSGEFAGARLQFERIRAVDAMEWAAVGYFSDQG